jgi:hypothetical protein
LSPSGRFPPIADPIPNLSTSTIRGPSATCRQIGERTFGIEKQVTSQAPDTKTHCDEEPLTRRTDYGAPMRAWVTKLIDRVPTQAVLLEMPSAT